MQTARILLAAAELNEKTNNFFDSCLKRDVGVEFECRNCLAPRLKLLRLGVNVVVEDCSLARELNRLKLVHPPARELDTPVYQLQTQHEQQHLQQPEQSRKRHITVFAQQRTVSIEAMTSE